MSSFHPHKVVVFFFNNIVSGQIRYCHKPAPKKLSPWHFPNLTGAAGCRNDATLPSRRQTDSPRFIPHVAYAMGENWQSGEYLHLGSGLIPRAHGVDSTRQGTFAAWVKKTANKRSSPQRPKLVSLFRSGIEGSLCGYSLAQRMRQRTNCGVGRWPLTYRRDGLIYLKLGCSFC